MQTTTTITKGPGILIETPLRDNIVVRTIPLDGKYGLRTNSARDVFEVAVWVPEQIGVNSTESDRTTFSRAPHTDTWELEGVMTFYTSFEEVKLLHEQIAERIANGTHPILALRMAKDAALAEGIDCAGKYLARKDKSERLVWHDIQADNHLRDRSAERARSA